MGSDFTQFPSGRLADCPVGGRLWPPLFALEGDRIGKTAHNDGLEPQVHRWHGACSVGTGMDNSSFGRLITVGGLPAGIAPHDDTWGSDYALAWVKTVATAGVYTMLIVTCSSSRSRASTGRAWRPRWPITTG